MARYFYTAKSLKGKKETGVLTAKNKSQLARLLKAKGLVLISAEEEVGKGRKRGLEIGFLSGVSQVEKLMFTRNLKVMVSAGVSLPRALELLAKQAKSRKFSQALLKVKEQIVEGKNFSDALEKHGDIFSELFSNMIRVGEASGRLEEVLDVLAKQTAREHELSSKIKGAMVYPIVIILAMMGIGIAMLLLVVPKISATFEELNVSLPASTEFVIWLGETMLARWYLLIFLPILAVFIFLRIAKTEIGKSTLAFLSLKAPIFSPIIRKINSAQTARTLSSLISAGVPITKSLEILSGSLGNIYYKKAMAEAAEKVRKGEKLSDVMAEHEKIYPILVIQMVAVGEETGQSAEILEKLADFFEEEVANATKNMTSVIEPLVMLLIGGVVGFFAIAMIQPMYSMLGTF